MYGGKGKAGRASEVAARTRVARMCEVRILMVEV